MRVAVLRPSYRHVLASSLSLLVLACTTGSIVPSAEQTQDRSPQAAGGSAGAVHADGARGGAAGRGAAAGNDGAAGSHDSLRSDSGVAAAPSSPDARGAADAPPPPAGKIPVFVAAGMAGRTVLSCDDGRTWTANDQLGDRYEDHSPYAEKGLVFADGVFVVALGWGATSSWKVSRDGVTWTVQTPPLRNLAGVAYTAGAFVVANTDQAIRSTDVGVTWEDPVPVRGQGGRELGGSGDGFVGIGGDGATPAVSFDGGLTWSRPGACASAAQFDNLGQSGGFLNGDGVALIVGAMGDVCRSADRGATWTATRLPGRNLGKASYVGGEFWLPAGDRAYVSSDGTAWRTVVFTPKGTAVHALARSDAGTFVGVERADVSRRFFRSTDGTTWDEVPGPSGPQLRRVAFGYARPSAACPIR